MVDGDTLDVVIDLGFYIKIKERIRLEGLDTPGIYGVPEGSEEYRRGLEAKEYVERRLDENGKRMIIPPDRTSARAPAPLSIYFSRL